MNIFYLDYNVQKCARDHADRHVVKMIVESVQILSSVYYYTGQPELAPYKLTHGNHPCCVWARESAQNWRWLYRLALALCKEYTYRYGKVHKCEAILGAMKLPCLPSKGFTPPAQAMDEIYKISGDPMENYRNYYANGKAHLLKYKRRRRPAWLKDY